MPRRRRRPRPPTTTPTPRPPSIASWAARAPPMPGPGNQPLAPTIDGDDEGLRHDGRPDQAPDRRADPSSRRARVQRDVAGSADRRDRGRQGPRDLHQQHGRVDRDPLPRTAPAERDGRCAARHPGPDPAGRQLHLRVRRQVDRLAHVPLAPQRHRPGRAGPARRVHRPAEGPGAALRQAVWRDAGHRLDQQRRPRRVHDQRPWFPGHRTDRRDPRARRSSSGS